MKRKRKITDSIGLWLFAIPTVSHRWTNYSFEQKGCLIAYMLTVLFGVIGLIFQNTVIKGFFWMFLGAFIIFLIVVKLNQYPMKNKVLGKQE